MGYAGGLQQSSAGVEVRLATRGGSTSGLGPRPGQHLPDLRLRGGSGVIGEMSDEHRLLSPELVHPFPKTVLFVRDLDEPFGASPHGLITIDDTLRRKCAHTDNMSHR